MGMHPHVKLRRPLRSLVTLRVGCWGEVLSGTSRQPLRGVTESCKESWPDEVTTRTALHTPWSGDAHRIRTALAETAADRECHEARHGTHHLSLDIDALDSSLALNL